MPVPVPTSSLPARRSPTRETRQFARSLCGRSGSRQFDHPDSEWNAGQSAAAWAGTHVCGPGIRAGIFMRPALSPDARPLRADHPPRAAFGANPAPRLPARAFVRFRSATRRLDRRRTGSPARSRMPRTTRLRRPAYGPIARLRIGRFDPRSQAAPGGRGLRGAHGSRGDETRLGVCRVLVGAPAWRDFGSDVSVPSPKLAS